LREIEVELLMGFNQIFEGVPLFCSVTQVSHGLAKNVKFIGFTEKGRISKRIFVMSLQPPAAAILAFDADQSHLHDDSNPNLRSLCERISDSERDASDITTRIMTLIRDVPNSPQQQALVSELREERRRLWSQIEKLERDCSPIPLTNPLDTTLDVMGGPGDLLPLLPPLVRYSRVRYRIHRMQEAIYEPIFARFAQPQKAEPMSELAHATGVPLRTLYNWKTRDCVDSHWRPGCSFSANRRIFTREQEAVISEHIRLHYLAKHLPLTMSNMQALILQWHATHLTMYPQDSDFIVPDPQRKFVCTRHFLRDFMHRNHLSYRCVRAVRRCGIQPDEIQRFKEELRAAYRDYPRSHIVNADESMWLVLWQPRKTIAEKGVESVKIAVNGDPKAGFTLIGSICANGERLPLFIIAKGLSARCHKQFGRSFPGAIAHSKSGWVNQEVFLDFLLFIRQNRGADPIALVLDQYPAHISPVSHNRARELNIKMILVPKGGTSIYQPLDRRIYGAMKSKARAKFDRQVISDGNHSMNKEAAAKLAHECWAELTVENIIDAWAINTGETNEEQEIVDDEHHENEPESLLSEIRCDIEYGHDDVEIDDIAAVEIDVNDESDDCSE
jgi:hypothetical protein